MSTKIKIYQPMKYRLLYFVISLAILIPGTYSLMRYGLKLSVDFTGGTTISWDSEDLNEGVLRSIANDQQVEIISLTRKGNIWDITTSPIERDKYELFIQTIKANADIQERELNTVGPSLGKELVTKTLYAVALASGFILLYITYRFRNFRFGISAIIAMLHDTMIILGIFSILGQRLGIEVDTLFVTAVLTILSFSVHDTIVVYDRIRELKKNHSHLSMEQVVNRAVVETMGRSINNSMTIIFMLLAMYLMGGETIKWFILALLIGTVSGTYSSTFTAAPLLVVWDKLSKKKT